MITMIQWDQMSSLNVGMYHVIGWYSAFAFNQNTLNLWAVMLERERNWWYFLCPSPLPKPVLCLAKRLDVPAVGWGQTPVLGELAPKRFSAFPSQHFPAKAGQLFSENIFLILTFVPPWAWYDHNGSRYLALLHNTTKTTETSTSQMAVKVLSLCS